MNKFVQISKPYIGDKEKQYINQALDDGWVSSLGEFIDQFQTKFAEITNTKFALATSNGTTALHLALDSLGVGPGDEVIVPDLTFIATANAVAYTGAKVVTADVDEDTLCISPRTIDGLINERTRAIVPVHLYGTVCDIYSLKSAILGTNISVVEDAAEAHGAKCRGEPVGSIGDCGIFSFYGNKILTTGEGGMITTNNETLYARAKLLRDHAMSANRRYWHDYVGYNYRMTNLQAAIGCGQLEKIGDFISKRNQVLEWYLSRLSNISGLRFNRHSHGNQSVNWLFCVEIDGITAQTRDQIIEDLKIEGVDSRPYFYPVSAMPMYRHNSTGVVSSMVSKCGLNLPTYYEITESDVDFVSEKFKSVLKSHVA